MGQMGRRSAALALAGVATVLLAGCAPAAHAAPSHASVPKTAAVSSQSDNAVKVDFTCTLADLFYSKLQNATFVQSTPGSGAALSAESLDLALIDDDRLDAAQQAGMTVFNADLSSLRTAVLAAKASSQSLPLTVPSPKFEAQDSTITTAITKVGSDCSAAGYRWVIFATGG